MGWKGPSGTEREECNQNASGSTRRDEFLRLAPVFGWLFVFTLFWLPAVSFRFVN